MSLNLGGEYQDQENLAGGLFPEKFAPVRFIPKKGGAMYQQNYNPFGNAFISTAVAAIPILVLLYFIALHRHRDSQGNVHLGISAPYAAFFRVIAAIPGLLPGLYLDRSRSRWFVVDAVAKSGPLR
jgi:hypothetical protein